MQMSGPFMKDKDQRKAERQRFICWLVGCLKSKQHASVSQRLICSDNCTWRHNMIEVADQTFYLTQSQCSDTGPVRSAASMFVVTLQTLGVWRHSHVAQDKQNHPKWNMEIYHIVSAEFCLLCHRWFTWSFGLWREACSLRLRYHAVMSKFLSVLILHI